MSGVHKGLIRLSAATLALLVAFALLQPLGLTAEPAAQSLLARLSPPDWADGHLLGTDHLGRDLFARLSQGLLITILIAIAGVSLGALIGVGIGVAAATGPRILDTGLMLLIDAIAAIPLTLLALAMAAVLAQAGSGNIMMLIIIIGFSDIEKFARVSRAQTLSLRRRDFVTAAKGLGASKLRIAAFHLVPNLASSIAVIATTSLGSVIALESALSFLGVGIQAPSMSLGMLVGEARNYLLTHPYLALFPAALIIALSVSIAVIGDWLRDVLDPDYNT